MRALITGITGFAGGHLAEHLLASGDTVLGAGLEAAWPAGSPEALRRVPLLRWDLADEASPSAEARATIARFAPECIFHLAALSVPAQCGRREPTPAAWAVNVGGTCRVFKLAASLAEAPRVVLISTSRVYWPRAAGSRRLPEWTAVRPRTGYARTKLAAERAARHAMARDKLDVVTVRAFQHAGPRQTPELMLAQWARQFVQQGESPVRVRHRDVMIDLSDVRDVVRAYRQLALCGQRGRIYNVGSGIPRRTGQIARLMQQLAGGQRPLLFEQTGLRWDPIADVTRLRQLGGLRPSIPLEQTVADTLADWQSRAAAGN